MYKNETQIIDGIYRLTLAPNSHFEFSQFLIIDKKTCLVHAGKNELFEPLSEMVTKNLNGRKLDYIVFSHVEADETGALNRWLDLFPDLIVVCNKIANINLSDFLKRPPRILKDKDILELGKRSLQLIETPHFPHNWDAHLWYETSQKILFSSDFCCQGGNCKPVVEDNISSSVIDFYKRGGFIPYGRSTNEALKKIMNFPIEMIAPMHGSVITGSQCHFILQDIAEDLESRL